jgi:predicted dehydrogenase
MNLLNLAIIGCGLTGQKRARAAAARITCCCDAIEERARALAAGYPGAAAVTDWRKAVARDDVDAVVVATTHNLLAPIAAAAARERKHVLVEKPGARRAAELDDVAAAAEQAGVKVRVGFNHRFHRAFRKAREMVASGALGPLMFVRGRYGHGARPGYENEWRAVPELSGGGELLDQGTHLIDLARWFLGEITAIDGHTASYFWNAPVEDNAFLLLRASSGQTAFLHASWTEWKNLFSFEITGRQGKLEVSGLGGSYGVERLTHHRMLAEMGPPETTIWEYPMADDSWAFELDEFFEDIALGRAPAPGIADAQAVLRVVETVYGERRA